LDVLESLAGGMTPDQIAADFPDLTVQDIGFCPAFAADPERKRNPLSPLQIRAGG